MINVESTTDDILIKIKNNRWNSSADIWGQIEKDYKKYLNIWKNLPEWLKNIPETRSRTRNNRVFLSIESLINKLTARPTKPDISPANGTDEAKELAEDLQDVFLNDYRILGIKKTLKRGLRYLFFSKIMVLKIFWDTEIDNYNVKPLDPRKIRFSKDSTEEKNSEFAIEEINEPLSRMIEKFATEENGMEEKILKAIGQTKEEILVNNPEATYYEMWIGDGIAWIYKGIILKKKRNPYWDWEGIKLTPQEKKSLESKNGRRRRTLLSKLKGMQSERIADQNTKYETYLFNHHDKPRKPYIFGTILEVGDKPTGETTLIEIINPLQENIDKRKRQIDDNADYVNGITKVDTELVNITLADARKIHYDAGGLVFGPGVLTGVKREVGIGLDVMVFNDLEHSIRELDSIAGTTATFRGEQGKGESATGRAILREENRSRLDELIELIDYFGYEIYNWIFQLQKVKYTETHYLKLLGREKSDRIIDIMQDDLQDGIEINIKPGQVLPDDRLFRVELATEDFRAGVIDPLTYFETIGLYDNPEKQAKRLIMFKQNPYSIIKLDDRDIQDLLDANETLQKTSPMGAVGKEEDERTRKMIDARNQIMALKEDPNFNAMTPEEKLGMISKIKESLK